MRTLLLISVLALAGCTRMYEGPPPPPPAPPPPAAWDAPPPPPPPLSEIPGPEREADAGR